MSDNKSKDIFYGVVAIATLIVALVGATLAYFSITKTSKENAVGAHSDTVSIVYEEGAQVSTQADELIPSSLEIVKAAYEKNKGDFIESDKPEKNACVDDNGKQVCSIYRFSISSEERHELTATLNNEENGFSTGLSFALYEVSKTNGETTEAGSGWKNLGPEGTPNDYIAIGSVCSNQDKNLENDCFEKESEEAPKVYKPESIKSIFGYDENGIKKQIIESGETIKYDLVLYLEEKGAPQNEDQGKEYKGTVIVNVDDLGDSHITGHMNP